MQSSEGRAMREYRQEWCKEKLDKWEGPHLAGPDSGHGKTRVWRLFWFQWDVMKSCLRKDVISSLLHFKRSLWVHQGEEIEARLKMQKKLEGQLIFATYGSVTSGRLLRNLLKILIILLIYSLSHTLPLSFSFSLYKNITQLSCKERKTIFIFSQVFSPVWVGLIKGPIN